MTSDDATGGPFDVDAVAAALRWVIGRAPRQASETADRALLRRLAATLDEGGSASARALDERLDAVLAEMAASGEIADHCAPRHRGWVADVARIYLGEPDALPDELRARIGSETTIARLREGVTNRARAAALALDIDANLVRVRREPLLLEAAAAALVARASAGAVGRRIASESTSEASGATPGESTSNRRGATADGTSVADHSPGPSDVESPANRRPTPRDQGPSRRRGRVLAMVGALAVVAAAVATIAIWVGAADDDEPTVARRTAAVATAPAVASDVRALGIDDAGALTAVTDDGLVPLGLDGVATADAARDGDRVHVVAERHDGHLVHTVLGAEPAPWADLGVARNATIGPTTEGTSVVVAVRGDEGELVRRTIGLDGTPTGDWARLSATAVVDVDMAANLDGRLEVGGVTEDGTAFNAWQSEPPDGWSTFADDRGGTDGVRAQLVANEDGRLELFVGRTDGEVWNTWQVAQGRGWTDEWDPRYLVGADPWRVAVGVEGRLVAVALVDGEVVLRQQVPVPQADGTTKLMWPPSTVLTPLDPLGGVAPSALTVVDGEDGAVVVASGDGRTVAIPVGPDGPGTPRPIAEATLAQLVPVDG